MFYLCYYVQIHAKILKIHSTKNFSFFVVFLQNTEVLMKGDFLAVLHLHFEIFGKLLRKNPF